MALITSNGTGGGLASATTTWAGGVVPAALDDVTIAAGDVVTRDNMAVYKSLTVNGTDKASRLVSSGISCAGNFTYNDGGIMDLGTDLDPLPLGITTRTDCVASFNNEFRITMSKDSEIYCNAIASERLQFTTLTADTALGSSVINVVSNTGWQVGDRLIFENPAIQDRDVAPFSTTILSIAGLAVTLAAPAPVLLDGTVTPIYVSNPIMPIWFGSSGAGALQFIINRSGALAPGKTIIKSAMFEHAGYNSWAKWAALTLLGGWNAGLDPALYGIVFGNLSFYNCFYAIYDNNVAYVANSMCVVSDNGYGNNYGIGYYPSIRPIGILFTMHIGYSIKGNNYLLNVNTAILINVNRAFHNVIGFGNRFNSGIMRNIQLFIAIGNYDKLHFSNTVISNFHGLWLGGDFGQNVLFECAIADPTLKGHWAQSIRTRATAILNRNHDPRLQHLSAGHGLFHRDFAKILTGTTTPVACIKFEPRYTPLPLAYSVNVPVLAGQTITATVLAERDATYNSATMPDITIKGEATTTTSMTAVAGVTEQLTVTSPAAIAGHIATVSINAHGNKGFVWFDDLFIGGRIHDIGQILFAGGTEISNVIDITDTMKHLKLTGIQLGSEVRLFDSTLTELPVSVTANNESITSSTVDFAYDAALVDTANPTRVVVMSLQYEYLSFYVTLGTTTSIPVQQRMDRNYL